MGTGGRRTGRRESAEEERESRFDWLTRRVQVVLAIVGTLVAIATGMFALANKVVPEHTAIAESSSLPEYHQSVGAVCTAINVHDRERSENDGVLRHLVAKARSPIEARDVILESVEKIQRNAEHDLAMLVGLDAPHALNATSIATTAVWQRTLTRLEGYAHRLDVADGSRDVLAAVDYNASIRAKTNRDITIERAGLIRLGGGACQLDTPVVSRAIRIGGGGSDVKATTPRRKPKPKGSGRDDSSVNRITTRRSATAPRPAVQAASPDVRPPRVNTMAAPPDERARADAPPAGAG